MKRHSRFHARRSRDLARLSSGQMRLPAGVLQVRMQEDSFDEHQIRIGEKVDQRLCVLLVPGNVGDIAYALTGNELENPLLELAQREHLLARAGASSPIHANRRVIGGGFSHLTLEVRQPWAGGQSQLIEAVLPHVDVRAFFE